MISAIHVSEIVNFAPQNQDGTPYLITGIICVIVFIASIIFAAIKREAVYSLVGFMLAFLVFMIGVLIINANQGSKFTSSQTTELQVWASETYRLDLTDEQALDMLNNQMDINDAEKNADKDKIIVRDSYNHMVEVALVKDGINWSIVQSSSELPATPREVK